MNSVTVEVAASSAAALLAWPSVRDATLVEAPATVVEGSAYNGLDTQDAIGVTTMATGATGGRAGIAPTVYSNGDPAFCVKESNKELCYDAVDNNCDGRIDEGCGMYTMRLAVIESTEPDVQHPAFYIANSTSNRFLEYWDCSSGTCVTMTPSNVMTYTHATRSAALAAGWLQDGSDWWVTDYVERRKRSGIAQPAILYFRTQAGSTIGLKQAIQKATELGADVINLALGTPGCDPAEGAGGLNEALYAALTAGALPVACAGNLEPPATWASPGCSAWHPGFRSEVLSVNGLNTYSPDTTPVAYATAPMLDQAVRGGVSLKSMWGYTGWRASGVDLVAPGARTLIPMQRDPTVYWYPAWYSGGTDNGCSVATPIVAGAVARHRENWNGSSWVQTPPPVGVPDVAPAYGNDARFMLVNMLLMADGWNADTNSATVSGTSDVSGFGRLMLRSPSTGNLTAPWAWGLHDVVVYPASESCFAVGDGAHLTSATMWKLASTSFEQDLNAVSDYTIEVKDRCIDGSGTGATLYGDSSHDFRKRLRLTASQIGGRCLQVCVRGTTATNPTGTHVYTADYFHSGSVAGH